MYWNRIITNLFVNKISFYHPFRRRLHNNINNIVQDVDSFLFKKKNREYK